MVLESPEKNAMVTGCLVVGCGPAMRWLQASRGPIYQGQRTPWVVGGNSCVGVPLAKVVERKAPLTLLARLPIVPAKAHCSQAAVVRGMGFYESCISVCTKD
jgi:hypothetical protein